MPEQIQPIQRSWIHPFILLVILALGFVSTLSINLAKNLEGALKSAKSIAKVAALAVALTSPNAALAESYQGMPSGSGSYQQLVDLYDEFLHWLDSEKLRKDRPFTDVAGQAVAMHPDYSSAAINERRSDIDTFHKRLDTLAVDQWSIDRQAEFLAVRARIDQEYFRLHVTRPWARDPGFYLDRVLRLTFTELPEVEGELVDLTNKLASISSLMTEAQQNLTHVAADYADLALFNLTNSDGVGHGFPYRENPPAGVIGWYDDFLARVEKQQPELKTLVVNAKQSIEEFNRWLTANRKTMTAQAGVGKENFNWYLKHVKLLPFSANEIVVLGERELNRLWSIYALEQHRNRKLPAIKLPTSAEEYQQRIDTTDKRIRDFLVNEEIITIPDYINKLATNVPWIVRDKGPNFWEQIQYRNPTPDHLHAVIPGHRFDAVVERNNTHPIRGRITDGVRTEGWGVYLEEAMIHAGLLDNIKEGPRVRELIYLFGIFRAARMPVDVWLQTNEMTVDDAVDYWIKRVPYLDADVARVDAEIYLRRPPGYGLGYMTGMIQMQALLADRKRQLGDDFNLREFHDTLMNKGRLPLSVLRWEMTGFKDEVEPLWTRTALPLQGHHNKADIAWISEGEYCEPETVLPLPDDTLLVSNVCGFKQQGSGFLTLLSADGEVKNWQVVSNLDAPLGMTLLDNNIFVVDSNAIKTFHWPSFELTQTIKLPTVVANDVAIAADGTLYVTDSAKHQVIKRSPRGDFSTLVSEFRFSNANGIELYGSGLYVGGEHLWRIDLQTESVQHIGQWQLKDIDGIEFESDGTLQITPVGGPLIRYKNDNDVEIYSGNGVSSANHGYLPSQQLALIPTGYDNTVIAIRVPVDSLKH